MKRLMMLILLAVVGFVSVQAQSRGSGLSEEQKQELKAKMQTYKAKLNLSPEQESKMQAINEEYLDALLQLKSDGGSRLSKYKKFKRAASEKDKQMKAVLNDEQYAIYKQLQEEMKETFKSQRRG